MISVREGGRRPAYADRARELRVHSVSAADAHDPLVRGVPDDLSQRETGRSTTATQNGGWRCW